MSDWYGVRDAACPIGTGRGICLRRVPRRAGAPLILRGGSRERPLRRGGTRGRGCACIRKGVSLSVLNTAFTASCCLRAGERGRP